MRRAGFAVAAAVVLLAGCTAAPEDAPVPSPPPPQAGVQTAERVMQVTEVHEATGMTLLEGPTFGADGDLYLVDVTAPPGGAKVIRVDVEAKTSESVYTDDVSALTSAQIGPEDGRLYVTDYLGGAVLSMSEEGSDVEKVFTGPVNGVPMQPDDLSFGPDGSLYITDAAGAQAPYWEPTGRVIRVDSQSGSATVLADELPSPNGIAFSPEQDALWVSLNTGNRVDRLTLTPGGDEVATAYPAIYASAGIGQVDSIAVDSAGNLYVGLHGRPEILVYDDEGQLLTTVTIPDEDAGGLSSATNIAIAPGTSTAYATVSGTAGGYLYSFEALAEGIQQSNGG
ncbi:SMP-30/gluconolactonase/LRE family protein [Microbacterium hatanonis]|uniref:SMP-30/gluconolactonase/LRE family protein n=2 Tax=Microbacterium hatanonis TaxID=404366 RepID=A0A5C8HUF4_9MICO|nr:SMP-30/gluconolactonase/LRE family protein [Microbacterium hatanonis]